MENIIAKADSSLIRRWGIFLVICSFLLYDFVQMNIMNSLSTAITSLFVVTPAQFGLIASIYFYSNVLLLLPAGFLLDRYNPKQVILCAILISLLGIFPFLLAKNLTTLILWRLSAGVAGAFSVVGSIKLISRYYSHKHIAFLIGLLGIVIMLGGAIAQNPAFLILNHYGLNYVIAGIAAFGIFVAGTFYFVINNNVHVTANHSKIDWKNLIAIFSNKNNCCLAFYASLMNFPLIVLGAALGNIWLNDRLAIDSEVSVAMVGLIFIGNLIGAPVIGFISDRVSARKTLMIICGIIQLINYLIIHHLMLHNNASLDYLSYLFLAVGFFSGSQCLAYAMIVEANQTTNSAKAVSLISIISMAAGIFFPPTFGYLMYYRNEYFLIFTSAILAIIFSWLIQKNAYSPAACPETN